MLVLATLALLQDATQHVELSESTRVSLGTAFAVLGPIAAGAAGGVAWLMRRFRKADEKREAGFQEMRDAFVAVRASVESLRSEVRALREESYETWCAHMMESYNLRLKLLNPKLKIPEIKATEIIALARAARAAPSGEQVKGAA